MQFLASFALLYHSTDYTEYFEDTDPPPHNSIWSDTLAVRLIHFERWGYVMLVLQILT